jgi:hypothetical protein
VEGDEGALDADAVEVLQEGFGEVKRRRRRGDRAGARRENRLVPERSSTSRSTGPGSRLM